MRIGILGPLEVSEGEATRRVGGPRSRTLLAALAVRADEVVPSDVLIAALWPAGPPADAANNLQTQVSRLRSALGRDRIELVPGTGYALRVAAAELDALAFEDAARRARAALDAGAWSEAADAAAEALACWRGDAALPEFADQDFAGPRANQL
ncbi:MAG TPA: winged helix-turn-helix domain-containing protein, partial [Acidimicrobiales bacterium]|nr:winged helix-turn-helix domain-containing protein [Acidimicrobiales bacterium]